MVHVFRWNEKVGTLIPVQAVKIDGPTLSKAPSGAEIAMSADGLSLYTSSRAANSIVRFAVDRRSGLIERRQEIGTDGLWPRSFIIDPKGRWLIAGNQTSKTITIFEINKPDGSLRQHADSINIDHSPAAFVIF